jgi:hypothetical protein
MRKIVAAALLVCVLAALVLYLRARPTRNSVAPSPAAERQTLNPRTAQPAPARATPVPSAATTSVSADGSAPAPPQSASSDPTPRPAVAANLLFGSPESSPVNLPAETVLENVRGTIRNYGSMFDGNPVGTNPEITAALNGDNPKGVHFLDPEKGMRVDSKGELVDPWGTPFFFHQLSGSETEIRSAGPDKQMWTGDDLVIK